jgi:hypothetical protein
MRNKRGQFYLISTIVIVGLVIGLVVTYNYYKKDYSYVAKEIANEVEIESAKVMDYDTIHSTEKFEDFARDYSYYVGEEKEIYFILVEGEEKEAYKYAGEEKEDLSSNLSVVGDDIKFTLEKEDYTFKLEDGKNLYFLIVHETGGERYVFSG